MPRTGKPLLLSEALDLPFTQSEVDFVVPDVSADRALCIDPFLLYKSRDQRLYRLHTQLLTLFHHAIQAFRDGDLSELDRLIDFPEVNEIGFGYTQGRIRGSGLGRRLNRVFADILGATDALRQRQLRHIEELQLLSPGIGPDRVSDIAANILKDFLIEYTQEQAALWNIPITAGVPISHYFDGTANEWSDGYFDLPQNPLTGAPILLVPRRLVRRLPWINYDDYVRTDFKLFLPSTRRPAHTSHGTQVPRPPRLQKQHVVETTRHQLELVEQYVSRKEKDASLALPVGLSTLDGTSEEDTAQESQLAERFIARLTLLPTGAAAADYQRLVYEILNYCFEPELTDGKMESKTLDGTERRDITYLNEAETSFWSYVRFTYGSPCVMFEVKNVGAVTIEHINQTATYLGAHLGMLGCIVTRHAPEENIIRKQYAVYNNTPSMPRKVILILSDDDLLELIRAKQQGQYPAKLIQQRYRVFRERAQ